ncbi:MAG: PilZ domain-containing protein [Desulforhopalus sp.]
MKYKRIHIRVPVVGVISLVSKSGLLIKASALDISENGIGINEIATCPENAEYQIQITTISHGEIHFSGILVHTYKNTAGFMITNIDSSNFKILKNIINDYQATEEFIKRIETHNIMIDWFRDNEGNEINVTFEV